MTRVIPPVSPLRRLPTHFPLPPETPDRRLSYVIWSESAQPSHHSQNKLDACCANMSVRRLRRGCDPGAALGQAGLYLAC